MVIDRDGQQPGATGEAAMRAGDVIKNVIAREAPGELAYFDQISAAFFAAPDRAVRAGSATDKPAAFGVDVHTLVTVVLLNVFYDLVSDQVKDAAVRGAKVTRNWLRTRRKRRLSRPEVLDAAVSATEQSARVVAARIAVVVAELGGDPAVATRLSAIAIEVIWPGDDGSHG